MENSSFESPAWAPPFSDGFGPLEVHGIYYSGAAEINELLRMFGIERLLPRDA